ncbi:TPA: hypothetical protein ACU3MP_000341 [Staphylococcus aureus]
MNNNDLNKEIFKTLCDGKKGFSYIVNLKHYPAGTNFFRVRELNVDKVDKIDQIMQNPQDFWNPPEKLVKKPGRLNKIGESLLYVSPIDPYVCINELKIKPGQFFLLIKYTAVEDINVNIIGGEYNYEKLNIKSRKAIFIHEMINNFLKEEYSREVGEGTEHLYKTSELIAKNFFDLPPEVIQDAWAYISTFDKKSYNVCFRPEIAKKKMNLVGGIIAKLNDKNKINCLLFTPGYDAKYNKTIFYELGSDYQKELFPEIKKY